MKIKVKWEISYDEGTVTFDLEDLQCETEKEWDSLTIIEKERRMQIAIDELSEKPSMILENWDEI